MTAGGAGGGSGSGARITATPPAASAGMDDVPVVDDWSAPCAPEVLDELRDRFADRAKNRGLEVSLEDWAESVPYDELREVVRSPELEARREDSIREYGWDVNEGLSEAEVREWDVRAGDAQADAESHEATRQKSWERSDIDGAMSQWASGVGANKKAAERDLARKRGRMLAPALFSLDGEPVEASLVNTRYGQAWRRDDTDEWINQPTAKKAKRAEATMAKKGYQVGTVVTPARVQASDPGFIGGAVHHFPVPLRPHESGYDPSRRRTLNAGDWFAKTRD